MLIISTYNVPLGQRNSTPLVNSLLPVISHPFKLCRMSRLLKICIRNTISKCKTFGTKNFILHFPLNYQLSKVLVCTIHPNYVFSWMFRPKEKDAYYTQLQIIFGRLRYATSVTLINHQNKSKDCRKLWKKPSINSNIYIRYLWIEIIIYIWYQ